MRFAAFIVCAEKKKQRKGGREGGREEGREGGRKEGRKERISPEHVCVC